MFSIPSKFEYFLSRYIRSVDMKTPTNGLKRISAQRNGGANNYTDNIPGKLFFAPASRNACHGSERNSSDESRNMKTTVSAIFEGLSGT
jgi:hypothetical protein